MNITCTINKKGNKIKGIWYLTKFKSNVPPLKTTDISDVINLRPTVTLAESKDHNDFNICNINKHSIHSSYTDIMNSIPLTN